MIKRILLISAACLFLVACKSDKTTITTDCSTVSGENAKRMDFFYQACLLRDSAYDCSRQIPKMFCEKIVIEYNEDYSIKSIQKLLSDVESLE